MKKKRTPLKAIIKQGDKYLILMRAAHDVVYPNVWDFPGGMQEDGEEPKDGLAREVMEETGLTIVPNEIVFTHDHETFDSIKHFLVYDIDSIEGDTDNIMISDEHSAWRWATEEEIKNLPLAPLLTAYFNSIL